MTIPTRPHFELGGLRDGISANQRLEHVMTLLEHILETMQRIEEQGKSLVLQTPSAVGLVPAVRPTLDPPDKVVEAGGVAKTSGRIRYVTRKVVL